MLFNSYIFILLFLPLSLSGWFLLNKTKSEKLPKIFLLGMSLWFYAYFNIKYLPIIVISMVVNYLLYLGMSKTTKTVLRKFLFAFGIIMNIGILFYYKYLGFFTENINEVFKSDFTVVNLVLPLGISFFTFQQVSFVIDSYKREVPHYSILDYALFVSYFPQLIAGPIVLHDEIIPQFADKSNKTLNPENFSKGIYAFAFGLAKKVIVADTVGRFVSAGFKDIPSLNSTSAFLTMLAYTIQIYYDFSGYCDMATGIGYMFNIKLPINFNSPYKALDMEDFWKRWHITLTRFLTKNLYIPLGGNRKGKFRTYINQFIVFVVSGIWHGANWTFILWGALNGLAVIFSKIVNPKVKKAKKKFPAIFWLITFLFINLSWIYFRADSISLANQMILKIFSFDFGPIQDSLLLSVKTSEFLLIDRVASNFIPNFSKIYNYALMIGIFGFAVFASAKMKNTNERIEKFRPTVKNCILACILVVWSVISLSGVSTFLYFNF